MTSAPRKRAARSVPPVASGPDAAARERMRRAFLAMALAHEIKQPLNSLNLNAELLSKRIGKLAVSSTELDGPLQAIGRVVDRVTTVLDGFYTRVQPEPVPERPLDLGPILEGAVVRASGAAHRIGVHLHLEIGAGVPPIPAHPDQLAMAVDALIENALLASSKGGDVRVHVEAVEDEVHLEIIDRGVGMTPEVARRAVEIGFSSRAADGTGMTIAKFVAYHHCGGFQIESRPGEGTKVTMVLPVAE